MSSSFRDKYGFLHHTRVKDGDPLTSENGPLFDATYIALQFHLNMLYSNDVYEYINRTKLLSQNPKDQWRVTPISDRNDFSRDNWTGVFIGLECCERKAIAWKDEKLKGMIDEIKKKIPIFHHQLDHPRDFLLVVGFKYKFLRPLCMWLPKIASIVSMYQTHKKSGTMAKTDGKIIGLGLCVAFKWDFTLKVLNKMLPNKRKQPMPNNAWHMAGRHKKRRWSWDSWFCIFLDYFNDSEHPSVVLSRDI